MADVDVVLLAGSIGPDPVWVEGMFRPLLPLPGTTVFEALLDKLRSAFAGSCTICANGDTAVLRNQLARYPELLGDVHFFQDRIPHGTAGCIKACESRMRGDVIFVASSSVWLEDDPSWMVDQHLAQGNSLTVFCRPASGSRAVAGRLDGLLKPIGLYCCDPAVMNLIPERGYRDLKEQLVPALRRAGHRVGSVVLHGHTREISDWNGYLHAVTRALARSQAARYRQLTPDIWCGEDVKIAEGARVIGPALLGNGCAVSEGALVIGPAILGDGSVVGKHARAIRVIAPEGVRIPDSEMIADRIVRLDTAARAPQDRPSAPGGTEDRPAVERIGPRFGSRSPASNPPAPLPTSPKRAALGLFAATGVVAATFVWAFWHSLVNLWYVWQTRGDYSAGQLVPLVSLYMIVTRRRLLGDMKLTFAPVGLAVFGTGVILNLLGRWHLFTSLENLSLVVCINGLAMSLIGWQSYKRFAYPLLFLLLMVPLPNRVHDALMLPLQGLGAMLSAGILEIIGVPVHRLGHVLDVGDHRVSVAEACSGLRMALAFIIIAGLVAFNVRRPTWQKVTLVVSSLPIAFFCNVGRIVVTACLYGTEHQWLVYGTTHELLGLVMVPCAFLLIQLELRLFSKSADGEYLAVVDGPSLRGFTRISPPGAFG